MEKSAAQSPSLGEEEKKTDWLPKRNHNYSMYP